MTRIVPERFLRLYEPLTSISSMLELGNKRNHGLVYKTYFTGLGIRHVSVDWNGKNGALPKDLRKPLDLGVFDMVSNIGTTEHVEGQEGVWRNIAVATGKIFVSSTPKPGSCKGHGLLYPTDSFYFEFAKLNGFEVERLYEEGPPEKTYIQVRMKRVEMKPFVMPDEALIYRESHSDKYTDLPKHPAAL